MTQLEKEKVRKMNYAWYFHDHNSDKYYYVKSHEMSVTEFARKVSNIVGYSVSASDTSVAYRQSDLDKRNVIHI